MVMSRALNPDASRRFFVGAVAGQRSDVDAPAPRRREPRHQLVEQRPAHTDATGAGLDVAARR